MTKTEHTKGPWKACEHGVIADTMTSHGNFYVASAIDPDNAEDKANMQLISACPELLAVVERLLYKVNGLNATERATRSGYSGSPLYMELIATIKDASAAIAKARGNA